MKRTAFLVFWIVVLPTAIFSQLKSKELEKQFINPDGVSKSPGYSQAVSTVGGKTIFVSGQVALNSKGELVGPGDLKAQTTQAFENMKMVLAASGATFADVVKLSYFVKNYDPTKVPVIRAVRDQYLPKGQPPPASTLVGIQSLFRDYILIEIEAIAVVQQ